MHQNSMSALLAGLLVLVGGSTAVGAVPELAFLAQFTGLGALVGAGVSLYRDRRHGSDGDRRAMIITSWTLLGTSAGVAVLITGVA